MESPTRSSSGAAADREIRRRVNSKLRTQHQDAPSTNLELPERLRGSDDFTESAEPPTQGHPMFMNMNQSIFGLIAAAGSRVDFNGRYDEGSSDEDDDNNEKSPIANIAQTTILQPIRPKATDKKRRLSANKLLKSLPSLPKRKSKSSTASSNREPSHLSAPARLAADEDSADSDDIPVSNAPTIKLTTEDSRQQPVMSRMLEAKAEMSSRSSFDGPRKSSELSPLVEEVGGGPSALSKRLMEIFQFDEPETVIDEYPCWLLQSVLLQGFLYITARHICFYAYMPKKANIVAKSGYLSKSGKRNPKYNRYWFRLKGNVLSYYRDATNLYFPQGHIDLTYGISATVGEDDTDGCHFTVTTSARTYHFRADSGPSAKEWVKSLQRIIFRNHNDGDSVKISLPINNVIDIEDTQMMEFADTCKIRVIDNDETYAMDEYFFSFFNFGREAINVLKILVEDASSARTVDKVLLSQRSNLPDASMGEASIDALLPSDTLPITESVKATLAPRSTNSERSLSPRGSMDGSRTSRDGKKKKSYETNLEYRRRSFSPSPQRIANRGEEKSTSHLQESADSFLQSSTEEPSYSNIAASSYEDPTASQILRGSEVFQSPTMRRSPQTSQGKSDDDRPQVIPSSRDQKSKLRHDSSQLTATTGQGLDESTLAQQMGATTPSLQSITKMGAYPLQRAGAFADYLNKTSKKMSSLLATESMGYVEKVSGMWKGGRKHYHEPAGLKIDDDDDLEEDSDGKTRTSNERFRGHFGLPETESLQSTYFGHIVRVLPLYGKIYISDRYFCFRSLLPGTRTKLILPLRDIENVAQEKGFRFGYSGLVVVIRGHEELFFEFNQPELRDDCAVTLLRTLELVRYLKESGLLSPPDQEPDEAALAERDALKSARQVERPSHEVQMPQQASVLSNTPTILQDESDASFLHFKPAKPMKITCLTIGSRGDVQPYIALCKGLMADGHEAKIATHGEFQGWIESHGVGFAKVEGDPSDLMRLCIENGTFTWAFLREANATFRGWLDDLLESAYYACQDAELLIESPSAMGGIHIAEKLGIPYFRAFTMPWTRTRAYPHAFIMPEHKMGGAYNYMTYVMFDNIFWKATAHQVNRWRNKILGLPSTSLEKMQPNKVPFLYNFSPSVVAPPLDFSDWIRVTGYWFLDEEMRYDPPPELVEFIAKAKRDGKKIVYVGFGSIIVKDPVKMTQEVIDAVLKADVRCILSKGWSDRLEKGGKPAAKSTQVAEGANPSSQDSYNEKSSYDLSEGETRDATPIPSQQHTTTDEEPPMPPEIHVIQAAPHDWLFKHVDAAAHHGGSGTTGASLRAGIPTIIRPFFGDQFFFAGRVEDLGVGVWVKRWGTNHFGRALWEVTRNERMIAKARVLGEQIRKERGVESAIQNIYRDMEYAKSIIESKRINKRGAALLPETSSSLATGEASAMAGSSAIAGEGDMYDEADEEAEEAWTFIGGDEPDPDMVTRKLSEMVTVAAAPAMALGMGGSIVSRRAGSRTPKRGDDEFWNEKAENPLEKGKQVAL